LNIVSLLKCIMTRCVTCNRRVMLVQWVITSVTVCSTSTRWWRSLRTGRQYPNNIDVRSSPRFRRGPWNTCFFWRDPADTRTFDVW